MIFRFIMMGTVAAVTYSVVSKTFFSDEPRDPVVPSVNEASDISQEDIDAAYEDGYLDGIELSVRIMNILRVYDPLTATIAEVDALVEEAKKCASLSKSHADANPSNMVLYRKAANDAFMVELAERNANIQYLYEAKA